MKKSSLVTLTCLALALLLPIAAAAAGHGLDKPKMVGILLVAFGSSEPRAQVSFENIARKVKATYPDTPVRWAYTSTIIRKKMAKQGLQLDSPEMALAKMLEEGFTHVAVQSLHTIAGEEYHDLVRSAQAFEFGGGFQRVLVGNPLMASQQDMQRTVAAILGIVPQARKPGEAFVLMGHGTPHPSNAFYAALMFQLQRRDPNVFIGCVEGYPEIDEIIAMLKEKKIRKAYLTPFMSVAGDHALNDMAGEAPDSWKSILTRAGIRCETILKGTAEYDDFVEIWADHIKETLAQFE
jgi:sirohydrochlorin cobaltochelatase